MEPQIWPGRQGHTLEPWTGPPTQRTSAKKQCPKLWREQNFLPGRQDTYHSHKGEIAELENETEHDGALGLEGYQGSCIVSDNVVLRSAGRDLIVETIKSTDMLICEHRQGEKDDQHDSDGRMKEVSEKRRFDSTNSSV